MQIWVLESASKVIKKSSFDSKTSLCIVIVVLFGSLEKKIPISQMCIVQIFLLNRDLEISSRSSCRLLWSIIFKSAVNCWDFMFMNFWRSSVSWLLNCSETNKSRSKPSWSFISLIFSVTLLFPLNLGKVVIIVCYCGMKWFLNIIDLLTVSNLPSN